MIKVTRKDKIEPKKDQYPCLMVSDNCDTVVLMTEKGKGTVVDGKGGMFHEVLSLRNSD